MNSIVFVNISSSAAVNHSHRTLFNVTSTVCGGHVLKLLEIRIRLETYAQISCVNILRLRICSFVMTKY